MPPFIINISCRYLSSTQYVMCEQCGEKVLHQLSAANCVRNLQHTMALVVICGQPSSGKSTTCQRLADLFRSSGLAVTIVDEPSQNMSVRDESYKNAVQEKHTRGRLKSAVDRALSAKGTIVLLDSLNNIKAGAAKHAEGTLVLCMQRMGMWQGWKAVILHGHMSECMAACPDALFHHATGPPSCNKPSGLPCSRCPASDSHRATDTSFGALLGRWGASTAWFMWSCLWSSAGGGMPRGKATATRPKRESWTTCISPN